MSIPNTSLLTLSAAVTFGPEHRGPQGRPSPGAWVSRAEEMRQRAILQATRLPVSLHVTSVSVEVMTLSTDVPLTGHFAFTYLGERYWKARTIFLHDQMEIVIVEENGMFLSGDATTLGSIPEELLEAALDWATDQAISEFTRLDS